MGTRTGDGGACGTVQVGREHVVEPPEEHDREAEETPITGTISKA